LSTKAPSLEKDYTRILALLESESVGRDEIASLAGRHGLTKSWQRFERKFLND
jgi:hypothetical protein